MGIRAIRWAMQVSGLSDMAHWVLVRLSWSADDDMAMLEKSPNWLADKVHMSERALRRHVSVLEKAGLVMRGINGYRLVGFFRAEPMAARPLLEPKTGPKMADATLFLNDLKTLNLDSTSSPISNPSPDSTADDVKRLTEAVQQEFKISPDLAKAVVCMGIARHYGNGKTDRIHSPAFFREVVAELQATPLPRGYGEYLEQKAAEALALASKGNA